MTILSCHVSGLAVNISSMSSLGIISLWKIFYPSLSFFTNDISSKMLKPDELRSQCIRNGISVTNISTFFFSLFISLLVADCSLHLMR